MDVRRFARLFAVLVLVTFVFAPVVGAYGPPWPVIDGVFEPLWEDGKSFDLWRAGDKTKPNPLTDGQGWALWDKSIPENEVRDLYIAVQMNSAITDLSFEENWVRASSKSGPILSFEEFAWLNEGDQLVGWESRVVIPADVCWVYVHTVTGPGGVETAGGSFDICRPTAVTMTSLRGSFWPVAVLPLLLVSLGVVVRRPRQQHFLC